MVTRPRVGGVSPTMTRMVVVLPAPLGPRNPVTRPGWQTKLTSSTAVKSPYFRVRPSTVIMALSLPYPGAAAHPPTGATRRYLGRGPPPTHVRSAARAPGLALPRGPTEPRGVPAAAAAVEPRLARAAH